jgi:site-specific DNA-methyltransferase (adenine-specific)
MACGIEDAGFEIRDCILWVYGSGFPKSLDISKAIDKLKGAEREIIRKHPNPVGSKGNTFPLNQECWLTKPTTPEPKQWEGWGTALKPAIEPIVVARKPLSEENVALNVLKWGTGGLNIDGCRVNSKARSFVDKGGRTQGTVLNWSQTERKECFYDGSQGRFPANLILECSCDEVIEGKERKERIGRIGGQKGNVIITGGNPNIIGRWPYVAIEYTGRFGGTKGQESYNQNYHPTVKPIKLMEYLVKLVTPPNGIVLDPFAGSGSTLIACKKLGFKFIGIEKEEGYVEIAKKRLNERQLSLFE